MVQQQLAAAISQLAPPLCLAAILSLNTDVHLSASLLGGKSGAALLGVGACCVYVMWCQRREWADLDKTDRAAKRAKGTRTRRVAAVESLAVRQHRLQNALREAEEDAGRVRHTADAHLPRCSVSCTTPDVNVRMGRSTDAADVALVGCICAMINRSYRHGYADILVSEQDAHAVDDCDEDSELEEGEERTRFTRTSFAEIQWRLRMCSDPGSARKLLLAFDSRRSCLGCCSVTAPYGEPRLGEWGLVCVAMHAQGQGIGSRLVAAAEAHCALRGCDVIQLEYFVAEEHEYSMRLLNWYSTKLGYQRVRRRPCGNQLRGYATSVPIHFEIGHKKVTPQAIDTATQLRLNLLALTQEIADRRTELCNLNKLAALPARTLSNLPEDIIVRMLLPLCGPRELRALAMTCTHLCDALRNAPKADMRHIWQQICHSTTSRTMLCYYAAELLSAAESFGFSGPSSEVDWKLVYRLRHVLPNAVSIVVDVGRGYTRFGLTQAGPGILPMHSFSSQSVVGEPPPPSLLQLCSSPSHPPHASGGNQFSVLLRRIAPDYRRLTAMKAIAAGDEGPMGTAAAVQGWQWPTIGLNIAREAPVLVGEPFWLLKRRPGRGRSEAERHASRQILEEWRVQIEQQCMDGCCVRFVPQPYMAMVAHGLPADGDALVLNLGLRECIACAVVDGVLVDASVFDTPIGGSTLTMLFLQQLASNPANSSWLQNGDMTWCRDQKEEHCFVRLPGMDTPAPVEVARPRAEALTHGACLLDTERWRVPEALFDPQRYGADGRSITTILLAAAVAAAGGTSDAAARNATPLSAVVDAEASTSGSPADQQVDIIERLLGSIVVVGGASGLPNLRRRIEMEVVAAIKTSPSIQSLQQTLGSSGRDRLMMIQARARLPAFEGTGRKAGDTIFQGGCILASSALGMERSLGLTSGERAQSPEARYRPVDRDPAPWLTRVKMTQLYREQCLSAAAEARAGQVESNSSSS